MSKILDTIMNEVYYYGGLPLKLGDIIQDMDKTAKQIDKHNWFKIREAGLLGLMQYHHFKPLIGVKPLSLTEFQQILGREE